MGLRFASQNGSMTRSCPRRAIRVREHHGSWTQTHSANLLHADAWTESCSSTALRVALGLAGLADAAAVMDQTMAEIDPSSRGSSSIRSRSIFTGSFCRVSPSRLRERGHVRIDDDARGNAKRRAQHDVGRLAADAGQLDQRSRSCGHLAAVLLDQIAGSRPECSWPCCGRSPCSGWLSPARPAGRRRNPRPAVFGGTGPG